MVAPCARVDVLVARLGRVEGVVRIVHLRENILEEKNFWIKNIIKIVHLGERTLEKTKTFEEKKLPGWREGGLEL